MGSDTRRMGFLVDVAMEVCSVGKCIAMGTYPYIRDKVRENPVEAKYPYRC